MADEHTPGPWEVKHDGNGLFLIEKKGQERREVRLLYDPETKSLHGREFDECLTPVPGERRQRRSGLAVVLDSALAMMREESTAQRPA